MILLLLLTLVAVSDKGGKHGYVCKQRHKVYKALRRKGMSKSKAARISNEGCHRLGRRNMAKKAWRTRKMRYGSSGTRKG